MGLGKRLKLLRTEKKLTQSELAKYINVARTNISKYENDQLEVNTYLLYKFADYFNVSVDYLLERTDLKHPEKDLLGKVDLQRISTLGGCFFVPKNDMKYNINWEELEIAINNELERQKRESLRQNNKVAESEIKYDLKDSIK